MRPSRASRSRWASRLIAWRRSARGAAPPSASASRRRRRRLGGPVAIAVGRPDRRHGARGLRPRRAAACSCSAHCRSSSRRGRWPGCSPSWSPRWPTRRRSCRSARRWGSPSCSGLTGCDRHLVGCSWSPIRRVRALLVPGGIAAGYLINTTIVSQAGTAAVLGPILIPLLRAGGLRRRRPAPFCSWARRWGASCSIPAPSRCGSWPS